MNGGMNISARPGEYFDMQQMIQIENTQLHTLSIT